MNLDTAPPDRASTDPGLTRAEGLWFQDCGLIIQAEHTLFRISRDFLAFSSPVFRDMFLLPPPKDADMMDGCPFVLLPDSAADVTAFLKALLHYGFFEAPPAPTPLPLVMSILRLSHKYEVDSLRKRALAHISASQPTTLGGWDALTADLGYRRSHPDEGYLLRMIVLARQLSLTWILPVAFYQVCKFVTVEKILTGPMDIADKAACINACRVFGARGVSRILDVFWMSGELTGCINPRRCKDSTLEARRDYQRWWETESEESMVMPLDFWERNDWGSLPVCDACLTRMKAAMLAAKRVLWYELPLAFGLPDWNELEKMKGDAFK
ncbi:hypothetical protein DFH06DRAFT_1080174 [Mycena polygramma]|nr:hypothetical protein DFH06DRAFT_1080174 [Mycena polygramma]